MGAGDRRPGRAASRSCSRTEPDSWWTPATPIALADGAGRVLGSPTLRARLAQRAGGASRSEFDVDAIARQLVRWFDGGVRLEPQRPSACATSSSSPATSRRRATSRSSGPSSWPSTCPSSAGARPCSPARGRPSGCLRIRRCWPRWPRSRSFARAPPSSRCSTAGGDARQPEGRRAPDARRGAPRRGRLHPKAWLVPDAQVLWHPFAVRAALRRARAGRWDALVATSFPPTAILIAPHDRRAPPSCPTWPTSATPGPVYAYHVPVRPAPLAELERRLEARMIRDAAAVVAVDGTHGGARVRAARAR